MSLHEHLVTDTLKGERLIGDSTIHMDAYSALPEPLTLLDSSEPTPGHYVIDIVWPTAETLRPGRVDGLIHDYMASMAAQEVVVERLVERDQLQYLVVLGFGEPPRLRQDVTIVVHEGSPHPAAGSQDVL